MLSEERKVYYKKFLMIAVPIMIQNGITNFVGMLDNVMVGRVGTDPMSGVAIVNQLLFVWNLSIFGGMSGIGIFAAQFFGKGDHDGIRYSFRLGMIAAAVLSAAGILIFTAGGSPLIVRFLHEDGGTGDPAATLMYAEQYLAVMLPGLLPFAITQAYAGVLKSCGETTAPMRASLMAVAVNLAGNYILIYGKFGAPRLGVVGAAYATVLSRFVEMAALMVYTHRRAEQYRFIRGAYRGFAVPKGLLFNYLKKGIPLLVNEFLWASSQTILVQNYSLRGLSVVAALNISQTIGNLFNVAFLALGVAIGIVIGQELGTGKTDEAKRNAIALTWFSELLVLVTGAVMFALAGVFPLIYNTEPEIRSLAAGLIRISAVCFPIYAFANSCYFVLRSGGKTLVTFLFDSCFCWIFSVPAAYMLAVHTSLPILWLYLAVQLLELIKCFLGYAMMTKGVWLQDLTEYRE